MAMQEKEKDKRTPFLLVTCLLFKTNFEWFVKKNILNKGKWVIKEEQASIIIFYLAILVRKLYTVKPFCTIHFLSVIS